MLSQPKRVGRSDGIVLNFNVTPINCYFDEDSSYANLAEKAEHN